MWRLFTKECFCIISYINFGQSTITSFSVWPQMRGTCNPTRISTYAYGMVYTRNFTWQHKSVLSNWMLSSKRKILKSSIRLIMIHHWRKIWRNIGRLKIYESLGAIQLQSMNGKNTIRHARWTIIIFSIITRNY